MRSHLKVKVVSLASEMTYIRRQELKWKKRAKLARERSRPVQHFETNFWSLRWHREELKIAARNTHLAYGCIKRVPYSMMERICYGPLKGYGSTEPDWKAIESMVERFTKDETNPQEVMQRFAEWLVDAQKWYEGNEDRISKFEKEKAAAKLALAKSKLTA